jgi:3-isopropylmalate/(R)-2-methylmalate dehydratase small subunit
MEPFTTLTAVAAPIDMASVDTDKILPARFLRKTRGPEYGRYLFHDIRFDAEGRERPEFVLNQPAYRDAKILVAGANFGVGSSREGAVYTLRDNGIRSVIAPSFGDIHYGNQLQNGMLPVILPEDACARLRAQLHEAPGAAITVDLEQQLVTGPDGARYPFAIDPGHKERLLKGLDDIGLVLQHIERIEGFELAYRKQYPWILGEDSRQPK